MAYNVKQVQTNLKTNGYNPGPIDGIYGPRTQAAVRAYQTANKIKPTGVIDNSTYGLLTKVTAPKPVTPKPVVPAAPLTPYQKLLQQYPDAQSKALINQAQQSLNLASQNTMEEMNQRGILNSTITADRVGQLQQQGMTELMPQLMAMRKDEALQRSQLLGYVDNAASKILGVPAGTRLRGSGGSGGGGGGGGRRRRSGGGYSYSGGSTASKNAYMTKVNNQEARFEYFRSKADIDAEFRNSKAHIIDEVGPEGYQYLQQKIAALPDNFMGSIWARKHKSGGK